jgi:hypothetical protein
MSFRKCAHIGALCLALAPLAVRADASIPKQMLPDRLLECQVRHITNYDPHLEQTASELHFDSVHRLVLFLPAVPVRTGLPPEPFEKAEKINPRTRIISDSDGIAPQPEHRFSRVVDYWPDRVELASTISGPTAASLTAAPLLNVIVINPIDAIHGTANLFMTRATELTHFDAAHLYQGGCTVQTGKNARKAP